MSEAVEGVNHISQGVSNPRRLLLEKQLDLAIQNAQKRYLKVEGLKFEKKHPSPPHLGGRVDILA